MKPGSGYIGGKIRSKRLAFKTGKSRSTEPGKYHLANVKKTNGGIKE
jgi:hypothetical protein